MKSITLVLVLFLTTSFNDRSSSAPYRNESREAGNEPGVTRDQSSPFLCFESMPEFPGGEKALVDYINHAVRYPERAIANGIEGKTVVRFVVLETGNVDKASIIKSAGPDLDNELIRVVRSLPKFKPGTIGDNPVPVWYMVPCLFILDGETPNGNKIVARPPENNTDRVKITLFPNPASDYLTIKADTMATDMEVSLVSSTGKVLLQQELTTEETRLSLEGILPGLILLTIKSPSTGFVKSYKVLKGPV
jgi:TonB family protein